MRCKEEYFVVAVIVVVVLLSDVNFQVVLLNKRKLELTYQKIRPVLSS